MPITRSGTAYELIGISDAPVVALIHGLGLNRQITWSKIAPMLASHFRVLSYDLCGHGETVLPKTKVNLTLLSEQLVELLDNLHIEKAALVGFSLGGMINRRLVIDHPERGSALVILNSPHERGDVQQKLVEKRAKDSEKDGVAANIDTTLARWFTPNFRTRHPEIVAEVRATVLANDHANYAAHRRVLAEGVKELIRPSPPISIPALVITCANDSGSTPDMSHSIAREIPGAKGEIIADLQHLGLIEQPQAFTPPIVAFLQRYLFENTE